MDMPAESGYAASWTTEGTSGDKTVTEAEWLECTEPTKMLELLEGKASDRKLRLFACVCVRRVCELLNTYLSRQALDLAEDYADGKADEFTRRKARRVMDYRFTSDKDGRWEVFQACEHCVSNAAAADIAMSVSPLTVQAALAQSRSSEPRAQCSLLREIFGPLRFRPITISPAVLTWNDAVVIRLAQAAYDERHLPSGTLDNGRLAVLADALEEAGCTDADILDHLRGPGPHVRGCWAVDLLLGES